MQIRVSGPDVPGGDRILTPEALRFVGVLQDEFGGRRTELLADRRVKRQAAAEAGRLDFRVETADVRSADWHVAAHPPDLLDRRVEITGPTTRKMTINALNSGANVWLADQEDANTPHWLNVIDGQINLYDAIRRQISFESDDGRRYELRDDARLATIVMRPRGWHLEEHHILADGQPISGSLVDFALYMFHNAQELLDRGSGPYFYLPKLEGHLEARLWNEVFELAEQYVGIPSGTIRSTVLIETIPAAFEMDEILFELRKHASGLNAGRWDYLFSLIKYFRDAGGKFVLPQRSSVGMAAPFMRAYADQLVRTCHHRGALAIGGMSAFIPTRTDSDANAFALAEVRADKAREAGQGFDGSWVAHPGLVAVCQEVFDVVLGGRPNQVERLRNDVKVTADELLDVGSAGGTIAWAGLIENVEVSLLYLQSWLGGTGAAAIHNMMEDAATAEISRSQVWQWVHNGSCLEDGTVVTADLVRGILDDQVERLGSDYQRARDIFERVALSPDYIDFLTLPAYESLIESELGIAGRGGGVT